MKLYSNVYEVKTACLVLPGPWLETAFMRRETSPGPDARELACKSQILEQLVKYKSFNTCVIPMHNVVSHLFNRATRPGELVKGNQKEPPTF